MPLQLGQSLGGAAAGWWCCVIKLCLPVIDGGCDLPFPYRRLAFSAISSSAWSSSVNLSIVSPRLIFSFIFA